MNELEPFLGGMLSSRKGMRIHVSDGTTGAWALLGLSTTALGKRAKNSPAVRFFPSWFQAAIYS